MEERTFLPAGHSLHFFRSPTQHYTFLLKGPTGKGASCLVYEGIYTDFLGIEHPVSIKELYPSRLGITRNAQGHLQIPSGSQRAFEARQKQLLACIHMQQEQMKDPFLENQRVLILEVLPANGTWYVISPLVQGHTLLQSPPVKLLPALQILRGVSRYLCRLHQEKWLCLDLKPANLLVFDCLWDRVLFFDFDSMVALQELPEAELTFTPGFAPYELLALNKEQIGPVSDVYEAGSLLYWLLFGQTPDIFACEPQATYPFAASPLWENDLHPEIALRLEKLLHGTLAYNPAQRWASMEPVLETLEELIALLHQKSPWISPIPIEPPPVLAGRQKELEQLQFWKENTIDAGKKEPLLVWGPGGIGKTTLVRFWLASMQDQVDGILYVCLPSGKESLEKGLADDSQIYIAGLHKETEETRQEYAFRKLYWLHYLLQKQTTLMVLDNFSECETPAFGRLVQGPCHLLLVGRYLPNGYNGLTLPIQPLTDLASQKTILEASLSTSMAWPQKPLEMLLKICKGYPLLLHLMGHLLGQSQLSLEAFAACLEKQPQLWLQARVPGSLLKETTILALLENILSVSGLQELEQGLLEVLALADTSKLDLEVYRLWLEDPLLENLQSLKARGLISLTSRHLELHPLLRQVLQAHPPGPMARQLLIQFCQKMESLQPYSLWMPFALELLDHMKGQSDLFQLADVRRFAFSMVERLDREQESQRQDLTFRLLKTCEDPSLQLRLYRGLILAASEHQDFENAWHWLEQAQICQKKSGSVEKALYWNTLADYWDAKLAGSYASGPASSAWRQLEKALQQEIRCWQACPSDPYVQSQKALAQLGLANVYMRTQFLRIWRKSLPLLRQVLQNSPALEKDYPEVPGFARMHLAWYACLHQQDLALTLDYLQQAKGYLKASSYGQSRLNWIDMFLVPQANMMLELNEPLLAARSLAQAIRICQRNADVLPCLQKQEQLLDYLEEVWQIAGCPRRAQAVSRLRPAEKQAP